MNRRGSRSPFVALNVGPLRCHNTSGVKARLDSFRTPRACGFLSSAIIGTRRSTPASPASPRHWRPPRCIGGGCQSRSGARRARPGRLVRQTGDGPAAAVRVGEASQRLICPTSGLMSFPWPDRPETGRFKSGKFPYFCRSIGRRSFKSLTAILVHVTSAGPGVAALAVAGRECHPY